MTIQKTKSTPTPSVASSIQSGNSQAKAQAEKLQQVLAPALENRKLSEIKDKKERLLELANIIERAELVKRDIGFNMSTFERARSYEDMTGHKCGTTACIAGWTTLYETGQANPPNISGKARDILELTAAEASRLFYASGHNDTLDTITQAKAVAVIRNLATTGKVEWASFNSKGMRIT